VLRLQIVGWVERQRNPTNADKCWVVPPAHLRWTFLNPTHTFLDF